QSTGIARHAPSLRRGDARRALEQPDEQSSRRLRKLREILVSDDRERQGVLGELFEAGVRLRTHLAVPERLNPKGPKNPKIPKGLGEVDATRGGDQRETTGSLFSRGGITPPWPRALLRRRWQPASAF